MRSIVLYADRFEDMGSRLETALSLARANQGHLSVLVDTPIARFMAMDAMGGSYLAADAVRAAVERDDAYAQELADRLQREDVPFTMLRAEEEAVDALAEMARVADILIVSRRADFAGQLAVAARTPVLALNTGQTLAIPVERVCVAWDGGYEAAAALRGSVPMLRQAGAVHVLTVHESDGAFPSLDAVEYLSRHGIRAELHALARNGSVEETLSAEVARLGAGLLVMGAFGRSRLREFLMGGVTRYFLGLKDGPALLLAH